MRASLRLRLATGAAALILGGLAASAFADPPRAITRTEQMNGSVTVKAVDLATRRVTLTSAAGQDVTFDVPEEYKNLERLHAGDLIKATYVRETEIKVSPRNARTPEDAATLITARAAEGQRPAGMVANKVVVTGALLSVDLDAKTVKLVSPQGGEVVEVPVTSAEGQEALPRLKIGDRITATITEGLVLAAVSP